MRRQGRICALQALYQLDLTECLGPRPPRPATVDAALDALFGHLVDVDAGERAFAERLVRGVARDIGEIDRCLGRASQNWKLSRMGRVDRNLLRLAAHEILSCVDIPRAASINEAIEIAKRFGNQESAAFVNGILDQLRPAAAAPAATSGAPG